MVIGLPKRRCGRCAWCWERGRPRRRMRMRRSRRRKHSGRGLVAGAARRGARFEGRADAVGVLRLAARQGAVAADLSADVRAIVGGSRAVRPLGVVGAGGHRPVRGPRRRSGRRSGRRLGRCWRRIRGRRRVRRARRRSWRRHRCRSWRRLRRRSWRWTWSGLRRRRQRRRRGSWCWWLRRPHRWLARRRRRSAGAARRGAGVERRSAVRARVLRLAARQVPVALDLLADVRAIVARTRRLLALLRPSPARGGPARAPAASASRARAPRWVLQAGILGVRRLSVLNCRWIDTFCGRFTASTGSPGPAGSILLTRSVAPAGARGRLPTAPTAPESRRIAATRVQLARLPAFAARVLLGWRGTCLEPSGGYGDWCDSRCTHRARRRPTPGYFCTRGLLGGRSMSVESNDGREESCSQTPPPRA